MVVEERKTAPHEVAQHAGSRGHNFPTLLFIKEEGMVYWVNSVDFNGTLREATSEENISAFGHKTLVWIQDAGLLIIAIATIIAPPVYRERRFGSLHDSGYEEPGYLENAGVAGAALLIALSILVIRFGNALFPYDKADDS